MREMTAAVDAAGGDNQSHADRDDDDRRHLGQVDVEGLPTSEMRRHREIEREQHNERGERRIALEKSGDVERGSLTVDRRRVNHGERP